MELETNQSAQRADGLDFTSGHVPYRNDAKDQIDSGAMQGRIPGWCSDGDSHQRPGVPREKPAAADKDAHWDIPERQEVHERINCSIERPGITPVFGTDCPPRGLSGLIRNLAYKLGEDRVSRWAILLLADRVDVVEGLFSSPDDPKGRRLGKKAKWAGSAVLGVACIALAARVMRARFWNLAADMDLSA